MNTVFIKDLTLPGLVGVYDHEKTGSQPLRFQIELDLASDDSFRSDVLAHTIDYDVVVAAIRDLLASRRFDLLEALLEAVSDMLLARFPVKALRMEVAKVGVVRDTVAVGVRVQRSTGSHLPGAQISRAYAESLRGANGSGAGMPAEPPAGNRSKPH